MSFLLPLFLVGLGALAVPVFIHLIQREKNQIIAFPSLMFVRRVPYESVRRRKIRHWLLLAMRLAALALIVAAFARPFVRGSVTALSGGAREVVILLDRSYSMGYSGRWERAQAAARQVVEQLGAADRASLVLFGTGAEVVLQSIDDRARLTAAIAAAVPGAEATRYAPALKVAGTIVAESSRPRREVVLVTDFQKNGWTPSDDQRLPAGTTFSPVAVGDGSTTNLSVAPAAVRRARFEGQERATITGGVTNRGTEPATGVTLALEIDGRVAETARVDVAAQASASHVFAPVTIAPAGLRGVVRLADDALAADNVFHFVLRETRPVAVLLAGPSGRAADDTYLRRALAIGESPRFDVTASPLDAVSDDALARAHVVIVNDAPLTDAVIARLAAFAERGGGVLVIAGSRAAWPQGAVDAGLARRRRRSIAGHRAPRRRRIRPRHLRAVPRAAQRRLLERARLRLPPAHPGRRRPGAGPLRRRAAGAGRADHRQRTDAGVDLGLRPRLERPGAQTGVPAVRPPDGADAGGVPRAADRRSPSARWRRSTAAPAAASGWRWSRRASAPRSTRLAATPSRRRCPASTRCGSARTRPPKRWWRPTSTSRSLISPGSTRPR